MSLPKQLLLPAGAAVILLVVIVGGFFISRQEACRDFKQATLQVDGQSFRIALAETGAAKSRGLAGCESIPKQSGMYFTYDTPQNVQFWMKRMVIPLDIIWVANGKVIGIEANVPIVDKLAVDPPRYKPPAPVNGVFEVAAGKAAEYGITLGSTVTLIPN